MEGKTCVITGANSGIGKETALGIAGLGARVVMVCRNSEKGALAKEEIIRKSGNDAVDLLLADLSSLQEVRDLSNRLTDRYERLDVLVNNAGFFGVGLNKTHDGFETTFAVNYLAPFLLTNLLLDMLKRSAPSRIVNVASVAHVWGQIGFNNLGKGRSVRAYNNSKLALVLFTYELARRLQGSGVTANCLHPGVVATNLWRVPSWLTGLFMVSAREGAETSIFLASSPEVEGVSGKYFHKRTSKSSSSTSYDEQLAERLWDASAQLVGLVQQETK